jgi:hypothetical protein
VVSVEERVPKPILFGLPSCSLKRRACLHALPSAPFNARCDGYGCGCRCHGSPPLLDRTSAECAWPGYLLARSWGCHRGRPCHASGTLSSIRKEDAKHRVRSSWGRAEYSVSYMFQSVTGIRWLVLETTIDSVRKARWGDLHDYASSPIQRILLDSIGDGGAGLQSYVSLHGAGRAANDLSKQPQNWTMSRKSRSRHLAKTSTGGPLPTYFCPIAPTSITRWSKMAGVGGIGSMRWWIRCWKG